MISKEELIHYYLVQKLSALRIGGIFNCSPNKINYWLSKYGIQKRSISEAIYTLNNPLGDPFKNSELLTTHDYFLLGLGLGLYWGEGNKRNKNGVRLGNSDPALIRSFMIFLERIYGVSKKDFSFGLQIFNTCDGEKTVTFWKKHLDVEDNKFYKTMIKEKRGKGTYNHIVEHGVLTIYFNNTKLRNILVNNIDTLRKIDIMSSDLIDQLNKPV